MKGMLILIPAKNKIFVFYYLLKVLLIFIVSSDI